MVESKENIKCVGLSDLKKNNHLYLFVVLKKSRLRVSQNNNIRINKSTKEKESQMS